MRLEGRGVWTCLLDKLLDKIVRVKISLFCRCALTSKLAAEVSGGRHDGGNACYNMHVRIVAIAVT